MAFNGEHLYIELLQGGHRMASGFLPLRTWALEKLAPCLAVLLGDLLLALVGLGLA